MSIIHWTEDDDDAMFGPARVEEHLSVAQHEKKYPPRPSEQMMVAGHEAVYDLEHDNWLCRHCPAVWEWKGELDGGYRPVTASAERSCDKPPAVNAKEFWDSVDQLMIDVAHED